MLPAFERLVKKRAEILGFRGIHLFEWARPFSAILPGFDLNFHPFAA
jgi:hypothetical protein